MTFNQLQLIFRAHLQVIAIIMFVVLLGAVVTALLIPKSYTSKATLVIDVRSPDSVFGNSGLPLTSPAYMNTQAEIVVSGRVIRQAIKTLKLNEDKELRALWEETEQKEDQFENWLVNFVQGRIEVAPGKESNTLQITASSSSPTFSAELANGISQAYIATSVALNVEPAKVYAQFFDEQKREARAELIAAQTRLSDFQRERGIVIASDDQIDVENARLNELSSALTQVQAQSAEQFSRAASSGEKGLLQDPMSNVVLNTLRTQLQQKQSVLAEASARIGENHPEYQRLKAEVQALQSSVNEEILRSNATLGAGAKASAGRAATLSKALEEQRKKILTMKENSDSAMALKRDLEAARNQFELVSTRTSMSEISSRQANANAFLVTEATVPKEPSSPRIGLIALSALLFGFALGSAIACITEFLDHRVRSKDDLFALGVPALTLITSGKSDWRRLAN
jgi:succinoglycan biosynthesis transport protein ExoP